MNSISGILGAFSSTMRGSTRTGLDVLKTTPIAPAVTLELYRHDRTPATPAEIVSAFAKIYGTTPDREQLRSIKTFLREFAWLDAT